MNARRLILNRLTILIIAAIVEVGIIVSLIMWFDDIAAWVEIVFRVLSLLVVLYIVYTSKHLSASIIWIIIIVALPLPGTFVYLLLGANSFTSGTFKSVSTSTNNAKKYYVQDETVIDELQDDPIELIGQFRYISRSAGFPIYRNEGFDYYKFGELGFPMMLEELKKAEKFIFLEYFIIEQGQMWDTILGILEEKAAQGVDVRVMYDDFGSMFTLSPRYSKELEKKGIKCVTFNKVNPILSVIINHRDHRKIMVIDGKVAFSGGINLADEYINVKEKYGRWKDNVIRIKGEAVWSYTVMFLTHWNAIRKEDDDYTVFKVDFDALEDGTDRKVDGYIAPYGETPLDDEWTSQDIYLSIINRSMNYCYIFTPYLIIDTDMINALILAAKSGVDVRIVTPGVPDKKIVYSITRSYYKQLLLGGVKIYEYTPGFIHAKVFVSDDRVATVGTINLDYRSLYLHFENGTYLYDCSEIDTIRQDAVDTIAESREVKLSDTKAGMFKQLWLSLLRLVAPQL